MKKIIIYSVLATGLILGSCKKFLDVNVSPNDVVKVNISQLLPTITVNVGYLGGSDLMRTSNLFMQQFSGNGPIVGNSNFKEAERYNTIGEAPGWGRIYNNILNNDALLIAQAEEEGSPHYAGVGKILKAFVFQLLVDAYGAVPYTEATEFDKNYYPKYDDGKSIYANLVSLIDDGIKDINQPTSVLSPNNNETIYQNSSWDVSRDKWERFANTLKLRIYLHYSKIDPAFLKQQMTSLISSGAKFMQSDDDNFEMHFLAESKRQNPLYSIENGQFKNQFYPNRFIVDMMNSRNDPRRTSYFVPFPFNSNPKTFKGASILDEEPSRDYSRLHAYIYGTPSAVNPALVNADGSLKDGAITYGGDSPTRLLTFAEYNFIRAEAAIMYGVPGDPQAFFEAGIKASFKEAGIPDADLNTYLAQHGTLTGSNQDKLEQIMNEKYVANFGVVMEPWTDYRRTGFPVLIHLQKPLALYDEVPRSLYYSQEEIDYNPDNVKQKASMLERVFWDKQ